MFVYGDSKWFEDNNYEEVCTFLIKPMPDNSHTASFILCFFNMSALFLA